eukprot:scaffold245393_cov31-Tisochrysis_lutea.AAC.1
MRRIATTSAICSLSRRWRFGRTTRCAYSMRPRNVHSIIGCGLGDRAPLRCVGSCQISLHVFRVRRRVAKTWSGARCG